VMSRIPDHTANTVSVFYSHCAGRSHQYLPQAPSSNERVIHSRRQGLPDHNPFRLPLPLHSSTLESFGHGTKEANLTTLLVLSRNFHYNRTFLTLCCVPRLLVFRVFSQHLYSYSLLSLSCRALFPFFFISIFFLSFTLVIPIPFYRFQFEFCCHQHCFHFLCYDQMVHQFPFSSLCCPHLLL